MGYAVLLVVALLNPSQAVPSGSIAFVRDHLLARGMPYQYGPFVESVMNSMIFMPMPLLLYPLGGPRKVCTWLAVGFVASSGVELTQLFFLPNRSPQARDVLANTSGTVIGAIVLAGLLYVERLWRVRSRAHESPR